MCRASTSLEVTRGRRGRGAVNRPTERLGVHRTAKKISKKRTKFTALNGTHTKTSDPAEPGARDDAAAHAGDQAPAALQSGLDCLCRERAGAQSAAGARRRGRRGAGGRE